MSLDADVRDMRDPQALGETIIESAFLARNAYGKFSASKVYDVHVSKLDIPDYDPRPVDHSAARRRELEERAAAGDRFAKALLSGGSLAEDPVD